MRPKYKAAGVDHPPKACETKADKRRRDQDIVDAIRNEKGASINIHLNVVLSGLMFKLH